MSRQPSGREKIKLRIVALCLAVVLCTGSTGYSQTESRESFSPAIDQVVHDACGKTVVLLGEPPVHGFGKVLDFKAELTRRLVDQCHFNGFFIESGIYDFLNIEKVQR